jgi:hypothetical protein
MTELWPIWCLTWPLPVIEKGIYLRLKYSLPNQQSEEQQITANPNLQSVN